MALQYLLAPKVKAQKTDKGKMDDIRIQGSDYGTIIPNTWGKVRTAGNVVFSSGIDHYTVNSGGNSPGKKNPGGNETTHIYKTSIAVVCGRGELQTFDRVWADSDLIINNLSAATGYFEAEDATLSGGAASYVDATASGGDAVQNIGLGGQVVFDTSGVTAPPLPVIDPEETATSHTRLSFYYKSATDKQAVIDTEDISPETHDFPATTEWTPYTCIVNGFANTVTYNNAGASAPNLDRLHVEKFWLVESNPFPSYRVTGIVDPNIGYPTNLDDPSQYYNYPPDEAKNGGTGTYSMTTPIPDEVIRFYLGTETQTADSKIKAWLDTRYGTGEGDLRASAMRGLAYIVFQDRTLKSNRVENFTFETDTGDATVNTILTDLFTECGLSGSDYSITATSGAAYDQTGFLDHTKQSRKTLVEFLERYHFFRIGEIDGKIYTIADTFTSSATIDEDSLRAHNYGEESPAFDAEVIAKDEREMPREVRVSVMRPDLEYHNESVAAHLFTVQGKETKEYTFPIVDTGTNARTVAEKLLLKEHAESTAYEFWGMPEMARYAIGDVITVPINGVDRKMRIEKKQMTLPIGKIKFQCVSINPFTPSYYVDDVTTTTPMAAAQYVPDQFPRNSIAFVIPSKPIRGEDKGKLGVYLALCGRGRGQGDTISLYREMDEDNYVLQSIHDTSSPVGICAGTLANHGGGTATEDTVNTLDIWFFDDVTLETVLQADIDRHPHVNLIRVGDEWLQFRTATVQTLEDNSPYRSKWRISNLWRGKYGTSGEIGSHAADEYAALVTPALLFFELDAADIGEVVNLKAVTNRQSVDVAPINTFTFSAAASDYTVTNATTDRTFDANATSIHELADVVATMIDDLNL